MQDKILNINVIKLIPQKCYHTQFASVKSVILMHYLQFMALQHMPKQAAGRGRGAEFVTNAFSLLANAGRNSQELNIENEK